MLYATVTAYGMSTTPLSHPFMFGNTFLIIFAAPFMSAFPMLPSLYLYNPLFILLPDNITMPQFLKQIAEHYYNTQNISELCFVFPNRRSMVFFRKWLSETAKNDPQSKVFTMPELLTMNDFFYKVSGSAVTDRVSLLLELYDCYTVV